MHIIGPEDGEAGADEESRTRVGFVSEIKKKAYLVGSAIYVLRGWDVPEQDTMALQAESAITDRFNTAIGMDAGLNAQLWCHWLGKHYIPPLIISLSVSMCNRSAWNQLYLPLNSQSKWHKAGIPH